MSSGSAQRRSRMSLSSPSPLGDAGSRANRRTSLGGGGGGGCLLDFNDESGGGDEIRKDRRAMLDEWRRNRGGGSGGGGGGGGGDVDRRFDDPRRPPSRDSDGGCPDDEGPPTSSGGTTAYHLPPRPASATSTTTTTPSLGDAASTVGGSSNDRGGGVGGGGEEDGLSALERYRLRKRMGSTPRDGGVGAAVVAVAPHGGGQRFFPPSTPTVGPTSSGYADEDDASTASGCYSNVGLSLGTPKKGRGLSSANSLGGGAQRRVRRRTSLSPSTASEPPVVINQQQHASSSDHHPHQHPRRSRPMLPPAYPIHASSTERSRGEKFVHVESTMEQRERVRSHHDGTDVDISRHRSDDNNIEEHAQTTDLSPIDSVDTAAMRSRLHAMQRRIESLEREKMELSMSKAPLEARMRQREDAWVKERERLCAEIEKGQQENVDADERYRELEMRNEALEEQNKRLLIQARVATSNVDEVGGARGGSGGGTNDSWSERLKTNNEIKNLRMELKNKDDEIKALRIEKVSLESEVYGTQTENEALVRNYDDLERDYRELESSKSQNTEAEIQLQFLSTEHTAMTAQLNATCADLEEIKVRAKADLQAKEDTWREREKRLLFEMSVLKSRAGKIEDESDVGASDEDPAILKAKIEERDRRITELEERLLSGEQLRRALHNRIQELRGNIRVYVRTRPFLPSDGAAARHSSIDILPDGESLTILGKHVGENHAFKFDKVFAPSTGQDLVFEEVSEFVQSALDGYHVCLFSYGQTGSGKTHTMQGSGNGAMRGIIPRAVEQILSQAMSMQSQRWTFTMKASFLEIYNEELRDLLIMVNSDGSMKPRDARTGPKLSIKRNADGKSFVDGINMVNIDVANRASGMAQLEAVISAAARARSVATTKMNAQSSRSHSVFMLQLCGINEESGTTVQGALNLCDLAGSERLDRSGAASDAQRLKETQAINKSLSCLGDVFTSLANGSKHVPFRNSKLTYLLQDCLSGDGKALMFVNLSPTLDSSNESLCSLRFAQRVNQVELGKATKNVQYGGKVGPSVRPATK